MTTRVYKTQIFHADNAGLRSKLLLPSFFQFILLSQGFLVFILVRFLLSLSVGVFYQLTKGWSAQLLICWKINTDSLIYLSCSGHHKRPWSSESHLFTFELLDVRCKKYENGNRKPMGCCTECLSFANQQICAILLTYHISG